MRAIELEAELEATKRHLNDVDGDLSKAFEEISKLKGMLNGDMKKKPKPKCYYYAILTVLFVLMCAVCIMCT